MPHLDQQPKRDRTQGVRTDLSTSVVSWFCSEGWQFPWRETTIQFDILIAEVLHDQTKAARVFVPYTHHVTTHPDPFSLAEPDGDVLRRGCGARDLDRRAYRIVEYRGRLLRHHEGRRKELCGMYRRSRLSKGTVPKQLFAWHSSNQCRYVTGGGFWGTF